MFNPFPANQLFSVLFKTGCSVFFKNKPLIFNLTATFKGWRPLSSLLLLTLKRINQM